MQSNHQKSFYDATSPEEALEIYLSGHDNLYGKTQIGTVKRALRHAYPSLKGLRILEVGCAGGIWTEFFLEEGALVTCVDVSKNILEANRANHPEASFVLGDAATVQLKGTFDLVFAKDVIEHIAADEVFLRNMHHHLRPGGRIVIATQNALSVNFIIQGGYHWLRGNRAWCGWDPTHVRFYTPRSLRRKLLATGFHPKQWFGSYYFPYRLLADHLGRFWESSVFCSLERLGLSLLPPLNKCGWNIGVVAEKQRGLR